MATTTPADRLTRAVTLMHRHKQERSQLYRDLRHTLSRTQATLFDNYQDIRRSWDQLTTPADQYRIAITAFLGTLDDDQHNIWLAIQRNKEDLKYAEARHASLLDDLED